MTLISGRMTYSSFYITASPIMPLLGILSYSIGGEEADSWEILYLYYEEPVGSFVWWSCRSGKETPRLKGIRDKRYPGTWPGVPWPVVFWAWSPWSTRAEDRPGIHGPAGFWAWSLWSTRAEVRPGVPGPAGFWA